MDIKVESIVIDPKIIDRVDGLDSVIVQSYADDMESGAIFPAVEIVSDGSSSWLVDGQHRLEAVKKLERETIAANVTEGDYRDALLKSCATNAEHGKRRTNEDKRQKVLILLEDEEWNNWSNREIARQCKVDHKFVGKQRNHTGDIPSIETERTFIHPKTGKPTTMNTTNIGGNDNGKLVQTEIEPIISAEAAYEEKVKLAKERWCQYDKLLRKANVVSETIVADYDEYDIRMTLENDSVLKERVEKAMDVNIDFIEGVKHGFKGKSNRCSSGRQSADREETGTISIQLEP